MFIFYSIEKQQLSNKKVVDYLQTDAEIYKEWVDKTYNNYHDMYQFFETKYHEH